jgi:hypothetical protein
LRVIENGLPVWQSPADWRVVDVALGDPNDDGRFEIMLAVRRLDPDGYSRSQPYIVGYRGGRYDLLWGGRPVRDAILEIELGNVDDDLTEELVVIEERFDSQERAIAVWQWQGWSFSLAWRSPLVHYRELALVEGIGGNRLDLSVLVEE